MSPNTNNNLWFSTKVIPGKQIARTLGFPTINLDNPMLLTGSKEGVYACLVKIDKKIIKGILYFGPRLILGEKENILEIFLFDFDKDIYGREISFQIKDFIRPAIKFSDIGKFKKQLGLDCQSALEILK